MRTHHLTPSTVHLENYYRNNKRRFYILWIQHQGGVGEDRGTTTSFQSINPGYGTKSEIYTCWNIECSKMLFYGFLSQKAVVWQNWLLIIITRTSGRSAPIFSSDLLQLVIENVSHFIKILFLHEISLLNSKKILITGNLFAQIMRLVKMLVTQHTCRLAVWVYVMYPGKHAHTHTSYNF